MMHTKKRVLQSELQPVGIHWLFVIILVSICLSGCQNTEEKNKKKAQEMMTAQTLGIAYLEEFKLDEAEKEFLKYIKLSPKEKLGYANLGLTYLRSGKYDEAKKQLAKAIKIDPKDPDIRLILATVYQMNDERDLAIKELKESISSAPGHIKSLYYLSELYSQSSDSASERQRENCLLALVKNAPENIVPRLNIVEIYIRKKETDKALEELEVIHKQFPEFPKEAVDYYTRTIALLKKDDVENALTQFIIFHNYLKVTSPYQAGIVDLKGPGGSLIGFPLISFDKQIASGPGENKSLLEVIRFADVTESAGLNVLPAGKSAHVEVMDYDGDGDIDLYAGCYDTITGAYRHFLFNNELGRFRDVSGEAGIRHKGNETDAAFADYDNDGFPDLFVIREKDGILYRNSGKAAFDDVTTGSAIKSEPGVNKALFFDADHDGDLDLFEAGSNSNQLFRNNGDGTFLEQAEKMGMAGTGSISSDAAFGDFDDDGDIDLVVINEKGNNILYSNERQGIFKDITEKSGLKSEGSRSVAAGDYNNDGFLDLFISSSGEGNPLLYRNLGNGTFEPVKNASAVFSSIKDVKINDAGFFDFDNDGYLDLIMGGLSAGKDGRGLFLYHNDGKGNFRDVSDMLPEEPKTANRLKIFDYNDDGDLDVVVAGVHGGLFLLRNDGGNMNHYVNMKLVGLRAGSAKNNHFGIGAKVEMRAGDLYQTMVVTDPNVHFGLGGRVKADVIRITWTNGVPQNIFLPGADQSLIESQTLKGSCPFLYTWDGEKFEFAKDILWRSGLGMPLGIMGGNTAYAFADASDDYIKIPGEQLKAKRGLYAMQITSELWETIYFDKLQLVAVDHPDSVDIFVPEQFSPPPFPGKQIYQVKEKILPVSATDDNGNDVLSLITSKDDRYIGGFSPEKYQGVTAMHDLTLDAGNRIHSKKLYMFLNGWIFPTDASINVALSQSNALRVSTPVIQVIDQQGEWKIVKINMGFPMGKDKTVMVDLSGLIKTADRRIRITTNMEIYWDQIFFSDGLAGAPVISTVLDPVSADLHYRGFSEGFRKGGRYGPHWFDYSKVTTEPKWRDLTGDYTRYGDVLPLLMESDSKYIISNAGDETTVAFSEKGLPALPAGWKRDFLIHCVGWVKDGDINTAFGKTVLPLPFHGMKSYPPGRDDIYPADADHQRYQRDYNTRRVSGDAYLNALKEGRGTSDK
jgi:tetratricopeptide (TPR) repeat protein